MGESVLSWLISGLAAFIYGRGRRYLTAFAQVFYLGDP